MEVALQQFLRLPRLPIPPLRLNGVEDGIQTYHPSLTGRLIKSNIRTAGKVRPFLFIRCLYIVLFYFMPKLEMVQEGSISTF